MNAHPVNYSDVEKLQAELDPWIEFMIDQEGSEIGSYVNAAEDFVDCATSAQENEIAYQVLQALKRMFKDDDGWIQEMVKENQAAYEADMAMFTEEAQIRKRKLRKSPQERFEALPAIT